MHLELLKFASSSAAERTTLILKVSVIWNILLVSFKYDCNLKRMRKNGSDRRVKKHNHDKISTYCPLKMPGSGTLLRNPDLDIGKKL